MFGIPTFDLLTDAGKQGFIEYMVNLTRKEIISYSPNYTQVSADVSGYVKQVDFDNHVGQTSSVHGIVDTSDLVVTADLISENVTYDNTDAELIAVNVKEALDELSLTKIGVGSIPSTITFYATTAASSISGYYRFVSSQTDPDYPITEIIVPTGAISGPDILISTLVSDTNIITGNPGIINITTVGQISKTTGNINTYADFYFKVYHRDSAGIETLIATSDNTDIVNPATLNTYSEFSASALTTFMDFNSTDRLVLKFYGTKIAGGATDPTYNFKFGGATPVRTLVPVPLSVIPVASASGILTTTSGFNNILSVLDVNVQHALNTLDDNTVSASDARLTNARTPTGAAGGVLSGTYPNPTFSTDMATQTELDDHALDTTSIHGITNTADLVLTSDARLSDTRIPTDLSVTNAKVAAAAAIVDTKLNTISTAGKVSNSATTATTANTSSTIVLRDANGFLNKQIFLTPFEYFNTQGTLTGTIAYDVVSQSVLYSNTNTTGNWTLNVRGDPATSLNSLLGVNRAITITLIAQNGVTAFYQTVMQIDGVTITPKWSGGTAPTSGNASSNDVYTFTILKTAATPTYAVFASITKWGA